ncbi:MAG: hypothetical protein WBO10_16150 [Pyrinomonadaceae bacterium]
MPEAAVDEDRDHFADEADIGTARDAFVVESVAAMARVPESFSEYEFGLGVFGSIGAHYTRDGFVFWFGRAFVADVHNEILARTVLNVTDLSPADAGSVDPWWPVPRGFTLPTLRKSLRSQRLTAFYRRDRRGGRRDRSSGFAENALRSLEKARSTARRADRVRGWPGFLVV